jgi:hypothetical protein
MIDQTDLLSLEVEVRSLIGEETAKFWTQDRVFKAINAEVIRLCRGVIALDKGYLEEAYTPTAATTVTLPLNCFLVRNVELYVDAAWRQPTWITDHQRGQYQSSSYPGAVQFTGNTLVFEDGIGTATSLRIKYARLPAAMLYQTIASGSATTAVLSDGSVMDDVYNGDRFAVLAGTGLGQVSTITDYVGSTKTCTIASGATLDATTVISTLLPEPLSKYPDVVAQGAAIRLLGRNRDKERADDLRSDYAMDLQDMMSALDQRQTEQVQRGNFIPAGDE